MSRFISEAIQPLDDALEMEATAVGEPAVPTRFMWRKKEYEIAVVVDRWKEHQADKTHGSGEMYVRKHWFTVRTTDGQTMKIYFERHARSKSQRKKRWWLFSIETDEE